MPQLAAFHKALPAGYRMQIGGEQAKQGAGFRESGEGTRDLDTEDLRGVAAAVQGHGVKPFFVLAAAPMA
jgi:hypothetical protein